uniref:Bm669 n=1 Tax=Brugia malayi TaxID=6279 RepID=A0A0J9Y229_BRUMA|nr:Bm669 [Brugia malayi]
MPAREMVNELLMSSRDGMAVIYQCNVTWPFLRFLIVCLSWIQMNGSCVDKLSCNE